MLRPADSDAMSALQQSAAGSDVDLDRALLRVGVLAPLDLEPIRGWFKIVDVRLEAHCNRDGHRVISVKRQGRTVAWVHHDGSIVATDDQRSIA